MNITCFKQNRLCYFFCSYIATKLIALKKKREMKLRMTYSIPFIYVIYQKITIFTFMFLKSLEIVSHQSQPNYLLEGFIRDIGASLLRVLHGKLGYIATAEKHLMTLYHLMHAFQYHLNRFN